MSKVFEFFQYCFDCVAKIGEPKVGVPATIFAWTLGHVTAEQILTNLSIFFVCIQIIIALPKLFSVLKSATRTIRGWFL
jgi:hypothetical protein